MPAMRAHTHLLEARIVTGRGFVHDSGVDLLAREDVEGGGGPALVDHKGRVDEDRQDLRDRG